MLAYIPQNMSRKRSIPFRAATVEEISEESDQVPLPKRTRTTTLGSQGYRESNGDEGHTSLDLFVMPQAPRSRRVASIKAQMANSSLLLSEHRHRSRSSSPNETPPKVIAKEEEAVSLRDIIVEKDTERLQELVDVATKAEITDRAGSCVSSLSPLSSHESELEEEKQQQQQQQPVRSAAIKSPFAAKIKTPVLSLVPVVEKTPAKSTLKRLDKSLASSVPFQGYVQRIASLNARACVTAMMESGRRPYKRKVNSKSPSTSATSSPTKEDILAQPCESGREISEETTVLATAQENTQPSSNLVEAHHSRESTPNQGSILGPILGKGPGYVLLCASPSTLTQCGIIRGSNPESCPYNTEGLLWSGDTIHPHARVYLTSEGTIPSLIVPPVCPVRPHSVTEVKERSLQVKKTKKPKAVKGDNGWYSVGDPIKEIILVQKDGAKVSRKYYAGIRRKNEELWIRDCITVRSGRRKKDRPFVAKIGAIWRENGGAVMATLFWYYRPEEATGVQTAEFQKDEILASQHYDDNSVACIEDKCHVLGLRQYCRYLALCQSATEGIGTLDSFSVIRDTDPDEIEQLARPNSTRQKKKSPGLVFLCHRGYNHIAGRLLRSHKH